MDQINLSYSAIDTFLRCPRKYEWQYITKIPTRSNAFFLLGGAYHKAIGNGFEYKKKHGVFIPTDEALDIFSQTWDNKDEMEDEEVKGMELDWAGEDPGRMKDDGYNLVKMYAIEQAPAIDPIEVELKVERDYAYGKFRGRIDLIPDKPKPKKGLQFKEEVVAPTPPHPITRIIEHKTSKRKKDQTEVNTSLQSYSYGFALGQPTEMTWHVAVRKKVPEVQTDLKVARSMDHVNWFEKEVLEPVARAILSGSSFYPCPSKMSCWGCNYAALCNPWTTPIQD